MLKIEKESKVPIYRQIEKYYRARINSNEFRANSSLPGDIELGNHLGISHLTVRQAYARLEKENLIYKIRGKGTFVSEVRTQKKLLGLAIRSNFFEQQDYSALFLHLAEVLDKFVHKQSNQYLQLLMIRTPLGKLIKGEIEQADVEQIIEAPLSGLFTNGFELPDKLYQQLKQKGIPVVSFPHVRNNVDDYIAIDLEQAIYDAIRYIKSKGRKVPAFLVPAIFFKEKNIDKEWLTRKINKNGLHIESEHVIEIERHFEVYGRCFAKHLLSTTSPIDAIVTLDSSIMAGACAACLELNIDVPEKLTLISLASKFGPPHLLPVARLSFDLQEITKLAHAKMQALLNKQDISNFPKLIRAELIPEDFPWLPDLI